MQMPKMPDLIQLFGPMSELKVQKTNNQKPK